MNMALVIPSKFVVFRLRSKVNAKAFVQSYRQSHGFVKPNGARYLNQNMLKPKWSEFQNKFKWQQNPYSLQSGDDKSKADETKEKISLFQRFKRMYRDYWYVLVPVHLVTSAAWFGGFYYLASSGVDIPALLEYMNFNEKIVNSMKHSSMGYFAIAYGLYKIATPVRYTVTLGGTTISINYLKRWGYIKPIPSKERLKEIYAETRDGIKEKRENLMENVHNLQQTVKETKESIKEKKDSIVSSVKESKESIKNIKQKVISSSTQKHGNKP